MASLLLGLPDEVIPPGYVTSYDVNKIGGTPDWMSDSPPPSPVCQLCQHAQVFLLQLYCPLAEQPYHRTIYVFACPSGKCKNKSESWTIVRCQKLDPSYTSIDTPQKEASPEPSFTESWGMEADDWGDDDDDGDEFPSLEAATAKIENRDALVASGNSLLSGGNFRSNSENTPAQGECNDSSASFANALRNSGHKECSESNTFSRGNSRTPPSSSVSSNADHGLEETTNGMEAMSIDNEGDGDKLNIMEDLGVKPDESVLAAMLLKRADTEQELGQSLVAEGRFVTVIEEPEGQTSLKYEESLFQEYSQREGVSLKEIEEDAFMNSKSKGKKGKKGGKDEKKTGGKDGDSCYEKAVAKHGDVLFQKFSKRIATCPQQILRYCQQGEPLHISASQQAPVPECPSCKSPRMFEFQMMPTLVPLLKPVDTKEPVIEFGTVLIYTCSRSCWADDRGYRTEYAVIEADPDQAFFK